MANKQTIEIQLGIQQKDYSGEMRAGLLVLETGKGYRNDLHSDAQVFWCGDGSRQCALGIGGGGDFRQIVFKSAPMKATQKNIDQQHARIFTAEKIAELTAAAKAYYPQAEKA